MNLHRLPVFFLMFLMLPGCDGEDFSLRFTRHGKHPLVSLQVQNSTNQKFSFSPSELPKVLKHMNVDSLRLTKTGEYDRGWMAAQRVAEPLTSDWGFQDQTTNTTCRIASFDSKPYLLVEVPEYDYVGAERITFCVAIAEILSDKRVEEFMAGVGSGPNEFTTE